MTDAERPANSGAPAERVVEPYPDLLAIGRAATAVSRRNRFDCFVALCEDPADIHHGKLHAAAQPTTAEYHLTIRFDRARAVSRRSDR